MYKKKETLADHAHFSPADSNGGQRSPREINNGLENQNVKVLVRIGEADERGAGRQMDPRTFKSEIEPGKSIYMDDYFKDTEPTEFKMVFQFDGMPSKDEVEGIKVIPGKPIVFPGKKVGVSHHTEFIDRSDGKYETIIHYKIYDAEEVDVLEKKLTAFVDVDPTITHPEWP